MKDTPKLSFSRFQTVTFTDKINKNKEYQTPRKLNKSGALNPELSTTIHMTPRHQRDVSLPSISQNKKRKKKGTFLQSWLDEALGAPQPNKPETAQKSSREEVDGGILKTLKKFQLDKRYLQSQNIPGEKVERLYQSLYIYTHGINQVFKELLEFIKEIENNDLLGNFWRAFTKLLEGCTSYQTVFQSIQKNHLQNIQRLRGAITTKHEQFEQEKKQLAQKIEKLQKKLEERQNKFDQLKTQYKIMQSTLGLTDQAFNEQVNLRLKFEEKINAVYTSYEELKSKYAKIVQQMKIKKEVQQNQQQQKKRLNADLISEKTKVKELSYLFDGQKQKVKDREVELMIKATQLEDLKQTLQGKESKQQSALEMMEMQIAKQKSLKVQLAQANNVILGQKKTIKQLQQHIDKLNKNLEETKAFNNEVYVQYNDAGKEIVENQNTIAMKTLKIQQLQSALSQRNMNISDLERQLQHVRGEKDQLTEDLQATTDSLKKADHQNQKNVKIIAEMKAIKDKYQRINVILTKELKQLQYMYNQQQSQISLKVQQIQGFKLMLDSKNKSLTQLQKQIQQERQTNKVKIQAQNSVINKKESLIMEYQKQKQIFDNQIIEKNNEIKKNEEKIALTESEKIKLEIQLAGKIKNIADLQKLLSQTQKKFQNLSHRLQEQIREKDTIGGKLQSKQFVLKTKSNQENVQAITLNNLIKEYKQKLTQRAQYVHPMLYEEQQSFAQRAYENEQIWKKENVQFKHKFTVLKDEKQELKKMNKKLEEEKLDLEKAKIQLEKQVKTLKNENKDYKTCLQKNKDEINDLQKKTKELYQKIEKLDDKNKQKETKINHQSSLIDNMKEQIKKLEFEKIQLTKNRRPITKELQSRQKETKKTMKNMQIQTQQIQQIKQEQKEKEEEKQKEKEVVKIDQETQTEIQEKKQIQVQGEEERDQSMEPMMNVKNSPREQKKVPHKDFKRALKLTYMRR